MKEMLFIILLVGAGLVFIFIRKEYEKEVVKSEVAQEMIQNGSRVYLGGQEVDPNVIILDDYKITIKDDIVILSE